MKKMVMILSMLLIFSCSNVSSEVPWSLLLIESTEANFKATIGQLSDIDKCDADWYSKPEYSNQLFSLFNMVREGNEYAFEINMLITDCLDGGNLGDSFRSMGVFFDRKPSQFFRLIEGKELSNSTWENVLVTLPLETVDDIPKKVDLLKRRLRMALDVKNNIDPDLSARVASTLTSQIDFFESLE